MSLNVLLVEDEKLFAKSVQRRLDRQQIVSKIAASISEVDGHLIDWLPDVVLLDVRLPDGSGLDLLKQLKSDAKTAACAVIMLTAYGELEDAVNAMKFGATDYIKKPVDLEELMLTLDKVQQTQQLNQKLDYSKVRERRRIDSGTMIGHSQLMQDKKRQIERIVQLMNQSANESPVVLITGETGTGKDVMAQYFHHTGDWHNKPFVHVDCASLPHDLIEAELFGYERGAFTNAHQAKAGLIEAAEDGTLFLDEIGELPLGLQAKLLNVLERRKVRRLGSVKEYPVNAHVLAATNRDLQHMVAEGEFRSDLYFRLNVLEIQLPPLRDRSQDILPLAVYFVEQIARRYGLKTPEFSQRAVKDFMQYSWPGNIRELQHVLERAVMLSHEGVIDSSQLMLKNESPALGEQQVDSSLEGLEAMTLEQVEKMMIEKALSRTAGNVSKAARELGLTRMAMRYRMEKYQL